MKISLILFLMAVIVSSSLCCECETWGQLLVQVPAGSNRYDCGSKIEWQCNKPFSFTTTYHCIPNDASCQAKIRWEVRSSTGAIIKSGTTANNQINGFNLPANGTYTLILNASCNGKTCKPCVYTIISNCSTTCECGTWGQLLVRIPAGSARFDCFSQIEWKSNQPFSFTSTYRCNPDNGTCQAKTKWEVRSVGGALIKTGTGTNNMNDGFNLPSSGIYILKLNGSCNGIECKPCEYKIVVH